MGLFGWIFYIILGIVFFVIISFFERKYNITKVEKLVISIILLMFISGVCFRLAINYTDNIFISFVFLMVVDIIYSSYFTSKDFFDKEDENILYYIILVIVGFIVNQEFINDVSEVFLTGEDLREVLWFLSIIFIYNFIKERNILKGQKNKNRYMSVDAVLVSYVKLKQKYYESLDYENRDLVNAIYAIMVYQNSKRSALLRNFDYMMFRLNGEKRKLGIMQVESSKFISDIESINLVYKKLEKLYNKDSKTKVSKNNKIYEVIDKYSKDNSDYIKYIFDVIKKF